MIPIEKSTIIVQISDSLGSTLAKAASSYEKALSGKYDIELVG